jgi:very-short-patch-repair endonuclease
VADVKGHAGAAALRNLLDRRTFVLTHSELERRFLPIARRAGLPKPQTQRWLNDSRVDFYWPELNLVVETDGLRYHRTPAQQAVDRRRDQELAAAGLTPLRFTHEQIAHEAERVESVLARVGDRLLSGEPSE